MSDNSNTSIPENEGDMNRLKNTNFPNISLPNQDGNLLNLHRPDTFRMVLYFYPMTGRPDRPLPDNWNDIPGAKGCTIETCSFRDKYDEIITLNAVPIGISTQDVDHNKEMTSRLQIPYDVLSDEKLELCNELNIKYEKVNFINTNSTVELFKNSRADLGLSLGNGYIGKKVFSIPKFGMINVHTELLPRFQGAQSIIWPIYENIKSTGFTIHKIDTSIDTGNILYKEDFPIKFYSTLEKTVRFNIELTRKKLSKALSDVCENFKKFNDKSIMQIDGKTYTTPTIFQYYKMKKNNLKLYKLQLKNDI